MRLPSLAILFALTACGTEPDPKQDTVPGRNVVGTLCSAGCTAGVESTIVTSKWIQLDEGVYEFAGELDATPAPPAQTDGTHGALDPVLDPCAAVAYTGSCAETCGAPAAVQGAGGSCVAIACPTEVVIARCDL
jgi:hypothetical protein